MITIKQQMDRIEVGLFISGSCTQKNLLFSTTDLEMVEKSQNMRFSVYDNHEDVESKDQEEGTGFPLSRLLDQAGATNTEELKMRSVDGFESVLSELNSKRYYYPGLFDGDSSGAELREAFVSFYKNSKKVKFFPHPTIMFGQQGIEDKNKDYFAKGVCYLTAGNRDQAFWVKGKGVSCHRYFSLDQVFDLGKESENGLIPMVAVEDGDQIFYTPLITLGKRFWNQEIHILSHQSMKMVLRDNQTIDFHVQDIEEQKLQLLFTDASYKTIGIVYKGRYLGMLTGFQIGEMQQTATNRTVRIPSEKESGDFYIEIHDGKHEGIRYQYTLEELLTKYGDILTTEEFLYYNHNMNQGRGGMRKVTVQGWSIPVLLTLLPEIPDIEVIESGGLQFQIMTDDNYKEKMAADGNELTAYQFCLAYLQDQRTETGMEKGDTSCWDDSEYHYEPIVGQTPFRIYCTKSSANPAVYKNVIGIEIELK